MRDLNPEKDLETYDRLQDWEQDEIDPDAAMFALEKLPAYIKEYQSLQDELEAARREFDSAYNGLKEANKTVGQLYTKLAKYNEEAASLRSQVEGLRSALENVIDTLETDAENMDIAARIIAEQALQQVQKEGLNCRD